MSDSPSSFEAPGLKHLESLPASEIPAWLERALRGLEPLPAITPDEYPEGPILRRERELDRMTRRDLRVACLELVRAWLRAPHGENDDYTASLIRLAKGLDIGELGADLSGLAQQDEVFYSLPLSQQKVILGTLIDLRVPLPSEFWHRLAQALSPTLKPLAISGLICRDLAGAFHAAEKLPSDEAVADSIFVILDQHGQKLETDELRRMKETAARSMERCSAAIACALGEWMEQIPDAAPVTEVASSSRMEKLNRVLFKFFPENLGIPYQPKPASACLVGMAA